MCVEELNSVPEIWSLTLTKQLVSRSKEDGHHSDGGQFLEICHTLVALVVDVSNHRFHLAAIATAQPVTKELVMVQDAKPED
jgi:hypothetical protein